MHFRAAEASETGDIRPGPAVHGSVGIDDGIDSQGIAWSIVPDDGHVPHGLRFMIAQAGHAGIEADVAAQVMFVGDAD